jgi:hypothetical protein
MLHERSEEHAARIARDLLRHRNRRFATISHRGSPPDDVSAILVSRRSPPSDWRLTPRGYWVRRWEGPPQLWVRNKGHAYLDTDPLLTDLLSLLTPQRERPLPFPDANHGLASRLADRASGQAELSAVSLSRRAAGQLDLAGGKAALDVGDAKLTVSARAEDGGRLLKLTVGAAGTRPAPVELSIALPAGWWLVCARDMTGGWDRVRDPVKQIRLPDGGIRLAYSFAPGDATLYLTFDLARLGPEPT